MVTEPYSQDVLRVSARITPTGVRRFYGVRCTMASAMAYEPFAPAGAGAQPLRESEGGDTDASPDEYRVVGPPYFLFGRPHLQLPEAMPLLQRCFSRRP